MTLKQIIYIANVAKYGSISEAAKKLYVSQPSLSVAIKRVETEYGITIFERSGKGVTISHAGEEFLKDIKQIAEYSEILDKKYCENSKYKMMFCVASMHYEFALEAFLKLWNEMQDEYNLGFLECKTLEVIENVEKGIADIGIISFSKVNSSVILNEMKNRGIVYHKLMQKTPHVYIREGHPLSEKENILWEDLRDYPALTFYQGIDKSINFSNELIFPTNSNKVIYISDTSALKTMLMSSDAYIVATGITSYTAFFEKILVKPIVEEKSINIVWISREKSNYSDMDRKYIEFLRKTIHAGL